MRTGRNLHEFAAELSRQATAKRDLLAPTRSLDMVVEATTDTSLDRIIGETDARSENGISAARLNLRVQGIGDFGIRNLGHQQLAEWCGIPKQYYDRMRETAPELLQDNVRWWLKQSQDIRMVRLMDNEVRAFLSNGYRPLENTDLFHAIVQPLLDSGAVLVSQEITDTRMYLKAVTPKITFEVKPGDVVEAGVVISNSEVGLGQVQVLPLTLRLICSNGAIHEDFGMKRRHVGRRQGANGDQVPEEWLRDETRAADDKAFFMKVQDVVRGTFDEAKFAAIAGKFKEATTRPLDADPVKVVEVYRKMQGLSEDDGAGLMRHLIEGGDLTQWGFGNAVTRHSQDVSDYDRATNLERLGGAVLEMPKSDWEGLLNQAN